MSRQEGYARFMPSIMGRSLGASRLGLSILKRSWLHIMRMFLIFILIFIAGIWLRFDRLGDRSFWFDEIYELGHVKHFENESSLVSGGETGGRVITLGYYFVLSFFKNFGYNEFTTRVPAAIFGILAIPLVYFLGKSLFDEKTGILSSFLLSISTFHIAYSQEARPYSMLCFFSILTLYFFYNALKRGRIMWWVSFLVATLINIYTHYAAFYVLGAEVVFGILWVLINFKSYKKILGKYGFILLCLFVLSIFALKPVIIKGINYILKPELLNRHIDDLSFNLGFFYRVFGDFTCLSMPFGYRKFIFIIYLIFFLFGIISSARKYLMETLCIILFITMPFLMVFTFFKPLYFFNPRYFIFLVPILIIGVSRGIVNFSYLLNNIVKKVKINFIFLILVGLIGIIHIPPLFVHHYYEKDNWRDVGEYLNIYARNDDVILLDYYESIPTLKYYLSKNILDKVPIDTSFRNISDNNGVIWFVVYADDNFKGQEGYHDFCKKLGILNIKKFGDVITLYKLKYLNKIKPGDISPIRFEAEDSASFIGEKVRDKHAQNGFAKKASINKDGNKANLLIYGPWLEFLPKGDYVVRFRIKVGNNEIRKPVVRIDVNNPDKSPSLIIERNILGEEFNETGEYRDFYIEFNHDGEGKLEFRVHYLGETDLWVDYVEVRSRR